ncbi:hypothetical protein [Ornithinibacillus sp. 179-J 7C1 HS]|uniref:hypothetical protein n=1 Tax=Ornithinibacillus sp. 179-J 7C1 HS TaxID=3142384 RepID=UPI0039A2A5BB
MADGTYTMKVNPAKKTIEMTVSGTFTPEKAQQFIDDYQSKVASINASEFVLEFDCRDLDVVTKAMIPTLENCLQLYKSSGFKKVEVGISKSAIISMQLKRLANNVGLTNFEVIQKY